MERILNFIDELLEKAEHDDYLEYQRTHMKSESFYTYNLKVLKIIVREEYDEDNKEKRPPK